jgi:cell shape-determining protein MreC
MLESLLTTLDRIYLKANRLSSIVEQQRIELNSVRDENQTLVRVNLELNQRLQDLEQKLQQGGNMVPVEKFEELKREIDLIIKNIDNKIG